MPLFESFLLTLTINHQLLYSQIELKVNGGTIKEIAGRLERLLAQMTMPPLAYLFTISLRRVRTPDVCNSYTDGMSMVDDKMDISYQFHWTDNIQPLHFITQLRKGTAYFFQQARQAFAVVGEDGLLIAHE